MDIKILTIFPEMFTGPLTTSIIKKARDKEILKIKVINFRDYSENKHNTVDDYPFGGGAGMLLKPEPIVNALENNLDLENNNQEIILVTPQGKTFKQEDANLLATKKNLTFICGHYEGFDERIRSYVTKEYSLGDFVMTGGEIPAMAMVDAIARLIPGVIKEEDSFKDDSFFGGLLEYPQYTRPRVFRDIEVPEVLLSGNHEHIRKWRRKESLRRTYKRRPELLMNFQFTKEDKKFLEEIKKEEK
ncbi:tRNA (Guanine37-N(1)-) methyltransferase [Desulfonispora thiosulfatigenes DSM 11270]|uniref:tRNA (guanine-N(1)-)-methyltransferase n=1 Tax=Desulfonispora thiosulfatigenes DSM 11270 TaxID=656914 RepID=A0A1W1VKF8_DESTI|nr:tRNA (guanosine(37)-N1)-methyltransferase TrmD [Desulfonispora thiosulfatigenes]SMB93818.1 tRNA (Guanine37-N(1)-) methyltransferase [Desulfonispora thiosulfatigenes DSM 11270]